MKRYTKPAGEHVGSSANIPGPILFAFCILLFRGEKEEKWEKLARQRSPFFPGFEM
jgi:hypothetical protein